MSNYLLSKREAREAVQAMQREYKNYLVKFPNKSNDRFVIEKKNRINDFINFINASDDFELQQRKEIENLKQLLSKREKTIVQIIDSLIMIDANTAFYSLTCLLQFAPDQTARFASLRREVFHKFDLNRFFNTIDKL